MDWRCALCHDRRQQQADQLPLTTGFRLRKQLREPDPRGPIGDAKGSCGGSEALAGDEEGRQFGLGSVN